MGWAHHVDPESVIVFATVFFALRSRKEKPSFFTTLACCAIAALLLGLVIRVIARMTA
jgi:hypothetical protein